MSGTLPVFTSEQGKAEVLDAYDAVLRKWPVPCAELDVPTTFGDTHVILSGSAGAPAVVMLHAFFATATSWYATAAALSERHRVFAVDIMGEANKSRPTRVISSADDYLQWFSQLADGLGLDRMSLVGNSMGGFGAAYCAMHMPGRVRRLALISPAATFHSILPFYTHIFLPKAAYLFFPWLPGIEWTMRRSVDWAFAGLPATGHGKSCSTGPCCTGLRRPGSCPGFSPVRSLPGSRRPRCCWLASRRGSTDPRRQQVPHGGSCPGAGRADPPRPSRRCHRQSRRRQRLAHRVSWRPT